MTVQSLTKRSVALLGAAILAGAGLAAIAPGAHAVAPANCSRYTPGWNMIPQEGGGVLFEQDSRCGYDPLLPRPQTDEEKRRQEEERQRLLDELRNNPNPDGLFAGNGSGGGGFGFIGGSFGGFGPGTVNVGDVEKVTDPGNIQTD